MRLTVGLIVAFVVSTVVAAGIIPRENEDLLVVHEWGTFTSFSGSDGVHLEFRPLIDNDLPGFVYGRPRQAGDIAALIRKKEVPARQRMETPVTYFYTDRPREVEVSVGFPQGLLTEFYPPVRNMAPAYNAKEQPNLTESVLDWGRVRLLPEKDFRALAAAAADPKSAPSIPASKGNDHYAAARETDSAVIEFHDTDGKHGRHYEKFLFYRGVGNFHLPVVLTASGADQYEVTNYGDEEIRSLFLLEVSGEDIRFARYDRVDAGGQLKMAVPSASSSVDELAETMIASLVDEGLYEKEARAMVKTWRDSWFAEPGARLLYMVPRKLTDELLPIQIEPRPDELVRVLVGRLEIMSPETEQAITKLVTEISTTDDVKACKQATVQLARYGRFAEPALERVRGISSDETVRRHAEALIHWIRRQ